jgi:hypothetical protein
MIFYLIPAHGGEPKRIEATQDEARATCKARGLRPSEFQKHDVPTDKAGLRDYVNDLLGMVPGTPQTAAEAHSGASASDAPRIAQHTPAGCSGVAQDGHPECRPAFTSAQVHASALPRSEKVQDVCYLVSKMTAGELGFVALEVVARGARLGGLAQ